MCLPKSVAWKWVPVALLLLGTVPAHGQDWWVVLTLHEVYSVSDDDAGGADDMYWKVFPARGGAPCDFFDKHQDGARDFVPSPPWQCSFRVSGADPAASFKMEIWDHDTTSGDDHFDIHPARGFSNLQLTFRPLTQTVLIPALPGWEQFRCAGGVIEAQGDEGDDFARIRFSISASRVASNGDSDSDGLPDSWEVCGLPNVNLPGLGADPFRKDLFLEIDWMVADAGGGEQCTNGIDDDGDGRVDLADADCAGVHSHEPWLDALITAWTELDQAPVTNPQNPATGVAQGGIALHVDVGDLYRGYARDVDGDGNPEIDVDQDNDGVPESVDLDGDGVIDIGDLGALPGTTVGSGNRVCADLTAAPCTATAQWGEAPLVPIPRGDLVRANNYREERARAFRYVFFGHQRDNSSNTSSGTVGYGSTNRRINIFVSLGTWNRQPGSPSGFPADGMVQVHTGTLLHELGHSMGLKHGGDEDANCKPNYLSIMTYAFQNVGIGFDLNNDDILDAPSRFIYSLAALPSLDETDLDERRGISGAGTPLADAQTVYGPAGTFGGANVGAGVAWADAPIDWNRNGSDQDPSVSQLASPPGPPNVAIDINNFSFQGCQATPGQSLSGFRDYDVLQAGGLAPVRLPGAAPQELTREAQEVLDSLRIRLSQVPSEEVMTGACGRRPTRIRFDAFEVGTELQSRHAEVFAELSGIPIVFLNDAQRSPTIVDDFFRSPRRSVQNRVGVGAGGVPLELTLPRPQRFVGLYLGSEDDFDPNDTTVVLEAFDALDRPLGETRTHELRSGFDTFLGVVAAHPDERIGRLRLHYEGAPQFEPVRIDDLILCTEQRGTASARTLPPRSTFQVAVRSVLVAAGEPAADEAEEDHFRRVELPLAGVPVVWNGNSDVTDFEFSTTAGATLMLEAPARFQKLDFQYWQWVHANGSLHFPVAQRQVTLVPESGGTAVATYAAPEP